MATVLVQMSGQLSAIGQRLALALPDVGAEVVRSESSEETLAQVLAWRPECIIIPADAEPPHPDTQLLAALRRITVAPIVLVGLEEPQAATMALLEGADSAVPASIPLQVLVTRVRTLLRRESWRTYQGPDSER